MDEKISQELNNILTSANYQAKVENTKEAIASCTKAIIQVSGLDYNQAKTCSYVVPSTYLKAKRKIIPVFGITGPTGTGKTQIGEVLEKYTGGYIVNAKDQTYAVVREDILGHIDDYNTILIEEMDKCKHSMELEEFVFSGYDRKFSRGAVNVQRRPREGEAVFKVKLHDSFTNYIVHRRRPFLDIANANRSIEVRTKQIEGVEFPLACEITCHNVNKMSGAVDLYLPQLDRPKGIEGRPWQHWKILLQIAIALGDTKWYNWAVERLKEDSKSMSIGREYEPQIAIFWTIVSLLETKRTVEGYRSISLESISKTLQRDYDIKMSHQNIHQEIMRLGLITERSGGPYKVFPTKESLDKAAEKLGIGKNYLEGVEADKTGKMPGME